jgi:hypothetical protein
VACFERSGGSYRSGQGRRSSNPRVRTLRTPGRICARVVTNRRGALVRRRRQRMGRRAGLALSVWKMGSRCLWIARAWTACTTAISSMVLAAATRARSPHMPSSSRARRGTQGRLDTTLRRMGRWTRRSALKSIFARETADRWRGYKVLRDVPGRTAAGRRDGNFPAHDAEQTFSVRVEHAGS